MAFLKLIRYKNLLIIAATQYMMRFLIVVPILAVNGLEPQMDHLHFFLLVFSSMAITAAGYVINDYFDIVNASRFPEMLVEVYSRWGDMLFSTVGYDDASRWDGTARGKDVPVGTYYYILIPYSDAKPITGNVTIIR